MANKQNDKAWFAKEMAARAAKTAALPWAKKRAVEPVVAKSGRLGKKLK